MNIMFDCDQIDSDNASSVTDVLLRHILTHALYTRNKERIKRLQSPRLHCNLDTPFKAWSMHILLGGGNRCLCKCHNIRVQPEERLVPKLWVVSTLCWLGRVVSVYDRVNMVGYWSRKR